MSLRFTVWGAENREQAHHMATTLAEQYYGSAEHVVRELSAMPNTEKVRMMNGEVIAETIRFDVDFQAEIVDGHHE